MSLPVLTFFNNKGGVGKTSLVYHLSSMFAELGVRVLAVDLDPQANLTAAFLDEDQLAGLWEDELKVSTIYDSVKPLLDVGDFAPADYQVIHPRLALIPGDLGLSGFEDQLSATWTEAMDDNNKTRPFRILTAFWRSAQEAAARFDAGLIVVDVGPNLGAINRAALLGSNHVVVPLGADLFSLQGLRNLGPTLREWQKGWEKRRASWERPTFDLPSGDMKPVGYIAMRHGVRLTRPVKAYTRWLNQIPAEFRRSVLGEDIGKKILPSTEQDPYCLAMLKNYNSLMPLAQEARKPVFSLRAADGAIGSHANAVQKAHGDFKVLAKEVAKRIDLVLPAAH
ncbi:ParA family protein [Acidovorax sp. NCPPB 4044]|uniref:ParA family protein n=1 Tax=Acidovorax sp. NCPPB 4044 TaxID=2940490 RepID=UPI0023026D6D|nr:AAA family ATPase [Acidovorax sp. NCPPB 4044]MDA8519533.1 AAA family ATPase [Acidovorax sp. NCPPB 4044]